MALEADPKDPEAIMYIVLDLTSWLFDGEIATVLNVTVPPNLTLISSNIISSGTQLAMSVTDGVLHEEYRVSFTWETGFPRKDKRSVIIRMEDR